MGTVKELIECIAKNLDGDDSREFVNYCLMQ